MTDNALLKQTILIADDSEMNRAILADMLGNEYDILEAENGRIALDIIEKKKDVISLVLLDIVMPEIDGFGVLEEMSEKSYTDDIPVIMISAENSPEFIERAYDLGVTDFISRPFDSMIVHHRVVNTILLYMKQKKLTALVTRQIYEKERQSNLMIEILSHIVEFRNGESGAHVRRVRAFTRLLLEHLNSSSDKYHFTSKQIDVISTASALHDIGKIAIDEKILNKPAKLTAEEFEKIKLHPVIADKMLEELSVYEEGSDLIKTAREICRYHHERYDGGGYPDGLKGDEIPVSAQIVSLADVYDALTCDRVYKKAIKHEDAVKMIVDGQCGKFNPELIKCFLESEKTLVEKLETAMDNVSDSGKIQSAVDEMLSLEGLKASTRTLRLMEDERMKHEFFAVLTNEVQFEYTVENDTFKLTGFGAEKLGLPEVITDPMHSSDILNVVTEDDLKNFYSAIMKTTPAHTETVIECKLNIRGEDRWYRMFAKTLWTSNDAVRCSAVIGKILDIHDSVTRLNKLKYTASSDTLTGLLNHSGAKERIRERIKTNPNGKYALVIFDLDKFKDANDKFGHMFGDKVLCHTAKELRRSLRTEDITARVGGDEFLMFTEYTDDPEPMIKRVFSMLCGKFDDFDISLSMGIATTEKLGYNYDDLFRAADKALYSVKRNKRGGYRFYDKTMDSMFSVISSIDE